MNAAALPLIASLAGDVASGVAETAPTIARRLVAIALSLVPVDDLKTFLSEEARKLDDTLADVAEEAKFGE